MKMIRMFLIILTFLVSSPTLAENIKIYSFGIVPQQAASKLAKNWGPLLLHLSEKSGIKLRFNTAPNIPEFEKRLANGEYDFAYMNPYHFVAFNNNPGYQALARARDKRIKGILVKRKDSDFSVLSQLEKQKLAFPSPAAFAASILPRAEFNKQNIQIDTQYVSSHDSVYRGVAKGLFPAGGGVVRTFNAAASEIREQLDIFWTSEGYTPHAIAHHPDVADDIASSLQAALLNLENDEHGKKHLKQLKIKGWEKASNADWDDIRALNIHLLDNIH
jgi:phosphonate transport system substrate-binding protein